MTTVLHIITGLDAGGAERMLAQVAMGRRVQDSPRQVVISLMDDGVHGRTLRDAGVSVYCLGMKRGTFSPKALWHLVRIIRRERPDIVMTWLYHADLVSCLIRPLVGMRNVIWNLRCSHMDFSRYATSTGFAVKILARLSSLVPNVVVTNSEAGRRAHEALGYRPRRWVYLPNGFDLSVWHPDADDRVAVRAELGIAEDEVAVVMVARVDPQKDHATFLAAAEIVLSSRPRVRLILIGRKTARLALPAALADRMIVLGERDDVPRLMRGMDLLVMSSAYGEGFPNVVGEAMATAIPCVVTDVGDAARIVGDTGLVVAPKDPGALAAAIDRLIAEPASARAALGEAARRRVEDNWPAERVVEYYGNLWRDILKS